jgi:FG-GAP-like repeat/FG-GAP repeat
VFLQNDSGTLNAGVLYASTNSNKIRIADLNHDGLMDVVGIGSGTNTASVWLQNNGGTLDSSVIYNVTHGGYDDLEVGDVNNDGLIDIIVMSGQSLVPNLGVLIQNIGGTFNPPVYYSVGNNILTRGVAVGDVNGDHLNDVVVTYGGNKPNSKLGVFTQNVSGTLDPVVSYVSYDIPGPVCIADLTSNGRADIIVLHGGWEKAGIYRQSLFGELLGENLYDIPNINLYNPNGLAVGDINGDGRNDIAIADHNYGLVILYNR